MAAPVAPAPEPVVEVAPRARVVEVVGAVERTRGEAWMELRVGDSLAPDEAVRTGPGARVDLQVGDEASRLSIPERSEVRVGELTRDVHTLNLERGRIDVDYGESRRVCCGCGARAARWPRRARRASPCCAAAPWWRW
ncbi:hypothetical protein ACN28S_15475 [Cystobacter fuscus]